MIIILIIYFRSTININNQKMCFLLNISALGVVNLSEFSVLINQENLELPTALTLRFPGQLIALL